MLWKKQPPPRLNASDSKKRSERLKRLAWQQNKKRILRSRRVLLPSRKRPDLLQSWRQHARLRKSDSNRRRNHVSPPRQLVWLSSSEFRRRRSSLLKWKRPALPKRSRGPPKNHMKKL